METAWAAVEEVGTPLHRGAVVQVGGADEHLGVAVPIQVAGTEDVAEARARLLPEDPRAGDGGGVDVPAAGVLRPEQDGGRQRGGEHAADRPPHGGPSPEVTVTLPAMHWNGPVLL